MAKTGAENNHLRQENEALRSGHKMNGEDNMHSQNLKSEFESRHLKDVHHKDDEDKRLLNAN